MSVTGTSKQIFSSPGTGQVYFRTVISAPSIGEGKQVGRFVVSQLRNLKTSLRQSGWQRVKTPHYTNVVFFPACKASKTCLVVSVGQSSKVNVTLNCLVTHIDNERAQQLVDQIHKVFQQMGET